MHPSIQALHPATTGLPAQEDFGYDNVGNREDITNPALYACDTNNRIITSPNRSYSFDADGNQLTRGDGSTFTYITITAGNWPPMKSAPI